MNKVGLTLAACSFLLASSSLACEFHEGYGGGAFGMQWQPYDPDNQYESYSDSSSDDSSSETEQKARPVFSNAAQRTSTAAKEKLADTKTDTESDLQDTDEL